MGVMGAKQAHSSFLFFWVALFCLAFLCGTGVDALKSAVAHFLGVGNAWVAGRRACRLKRV